MKTDATLMTYVRYGRLLISSGVSGLRKGGESYLHGQRLSAVLVHSVPVSLGLATVGACAGLLRSFVRGRHARAPHTLASGMVGTAIGFCAGLTWETRDLTSTMARSAAKQIDLTRDEHWLQSHPIDYA